MSGPTRFRNCPKKPPRGSENPSKLPSWGRVCSSLGGTREGGGREAMYKVQARDEFPEAQVSQPIRLRASTSTLISDFQSAL